MRFIWFLRFTSHYPFRWTKWIKSERKERTMNEVGAEWDVNRRDTAIPWDRRHERDTKWRDEWRVARLSSFMFLVSLTLDLLSQVQGHEWSEWGNETNEERRETEWATRVRETGVEREGEQREPDRTTTDGTNEKGNRREARQTGRKLQNAAFWSSLSPPVLSLTSRSRFLSLVPFRPEERRNGWEERSARFAHSVPAGRMTCRPRVSEERA